MAFIVETLADTEKDADSLMSLLVQPEEADVIYDSEKLRKRLESGSGLTDVSIRFFLYIVLRGSLKEAGVESREVCDYLANMLGRFMEKRRWRTAPDSRQSIVDSEFDIQIVLQKASRPRRYEIHVFGGDRNLYLTGMRAAYLRKRRNRYGAPGISFYEQVGRNHYRQARDHPLSEGSELRKVFDHLAEDFPRLRSRLNHLTAEYFN